MIHIFKTNIYPVRAVSCRASATAKTLPKSGIALFHFDKSGFNHRKALFRISFLAEQMCTLQKLEQKKRGFLAPAPGKYLFLFFIIG